MQSSKDIYLDEKTLTFHKEPRSVPSTALIRLSNSHHWGLHVDKEDRNDALRRIISTNDYSRLYADPKKVKIRDE